MPSTNISANVLDDTQESIEAKIIAAILTFTISSQDIDSDCLLINGQT